MASSALSVGLIAFLLGVMVSTFTPLGRGLRQSSVGDGLVRALTAQPPKSCLSFYSGYPLSPVYKVEELQPGKHPIPGLAHVTVSGRAHHGNRGLEVWMETMIPGKGTPIHRHNCEEVWLILSGTATVSIRDLDGKVVAAPLGPNSTFTVLPNAIHQVVNTGTEDLHAIIAIDNPPFTAFVCPDWEGHCGPASAKLLKPMFWDAQCPDFVPEAMQHLLNATAGGEGGAKAGGGEGAPKTDL